MERTARAQYITAAVAARQRGEQLDGTPDTRFAGERFAHIATRELRLLSRNATANGCDDAPHAKAYRAELARRESGQ